MKAWFLAHPEVLKECHENLRALFPDPEDYDNVYDYIDAISTLLDSSLEEKEEIEEEETNEGIVMNFESYQLLMESKRKNKRLENAIDSSKKLDNLLDSINKINVKGEEKKNLTVRDLMDQFAKASGDELNSDKILLS